jgi:hypothetical protein
MSMHHYEYMYIDLTPINTSGRLSLLDLEIHEIGHQERLAVGEYTTSPIGALPSFSISSATFYFLIT